MGTMRFAGCSKNVMVSENNEGICYMELYQLLGVNHMQRSFGKQAFGACVSGDSVGYHWLDVESYQKPKIILECTFISID